MQYITLIATFIGEMTFVVSILIPVFRKIKRLANGTKCQLRSEMLKIYYRNSESGEIRQYEYENFIYLYDAYKALGGNSFIDKIYSEVKDWEVIT